MLKESIAAEIEKQEERKSRYESLRGQLDCSEQEQISTFDPDSRQMVIRNNITEVAYNTSTGSVQVFEGYSILSIRKH